MNAPLSRHRPVMLRETLRELELQPDLTVVDGTVGAAGHGVEILSRILPGGKLFGLDRDAGMLQRAEQRFQKTHSDNLLANHLVLNQSSYAELDTVLQAHGIEVVDRILIDLGLSSDQLADQHRGFSFQQEGVLDMRFDTNQGTPIHYWLNRASVEEITTVLDQYGEDPLSKRIAQAIVEKRHKEKIETASQLTQLIEIVTSGREKKGAKSHPATRIFQALRIQANSELEHLKRFMEKTAPRSLAPGGRVVVITFHSLEDRLVKKMLQNRDIWKSSSNKPIVPTALERKMNPRCRSAKLRIGIRAD